MDGQIRLGVFTGIIYYPGDDYSDECCKVISKEQANDTHWISDQRLINSFKCRGCYGCPLSLRALELITD